MMVALRQSCPEYTKKYRSNFFFLKQVQGGRKWPLKACSMPVEVGYWLLKGSPKVHVLNKGGRYEQKGRGRMLCIYNQVHMTYNLINPMVVEKLDYHGPF
jgi:hypothetical protein